MVSIEQINSLLEFMKEHPDLAKGLNRGRRGKLITHKVWNLCAKRLNAVKHGVVKDGKGWSKYWCDWKYRVRRHAIELKAAKESNRQPLSSIEETIISIIGQDSLNSVQIRTDPLVDENSIEHVPESESKDYTDCEEPTIQFYDTCSNTRKRRNSSTKKLTLDDDNDSIPERKARVGVGSDDEDISLQFLRMEREKLEILRNMSHSLQSIVTQMTRVADTVGRIHDNIIK